MSYGKGSPGFGPNVKVLGFRLKTKDLPAPVFEVSQKDENGKSQKVDTATHVKGDLIGVSHKEYTFEKKLIESVTATFRDGNEVYFVSFPYSYLGRDLINRLIALKTFGGVEVSIYKSKPKDPSKNPVGFDSVAVRQNGELVYGKYPYGDKAVPTVPAIQVGRDIHKDYTAINSFYRKELEALNQRVKSSSAVVANEAVAPETADIGADGSGTADDVPF